MHGVCSDQALSISDRAFAALTPPQQHQQRYRVFMDSNQNIATLSAAQKMHYDRQIIVLDPDGAIVDHV